MKKKRENLEEHEICMDKSGLYLLLTAHVDLNVLIYEKNIHIKCILNIDILLKLT